MSVVITPIIEPVQLTGSAAAYYTAGVATRIDKMVVVNPGNAAATVTIYWVPRTASAGVANMVVSARPINTNEAWDVYPLIGETLAAGDAIWAFASTTLVLNFMASGTQVSG